MDPEKIHHLGLRMISSGVFRAPQISVPRTVFGVSFPNPIGLAAGFDKDGLCINQWRNLGFGFAEIGTVTRHAQLGNPKPRLFRLPDQKAVINRFGFNNQGADALAQRLESANPVIPLGINLGKSKITPLENAHFDYAYSFKALHRFGDYFVVNVSSPNTEGLRSLQDKDSLTQIFSEMKAVNSNKPLFVKIAPDLEHEAIDEVIQVAVDMQLTGIIATNTTIDRSMLRSDPGETGGLSGLPLKNKAVEVQKYLRANMPTDMTLIGVGGIMTPQDAVERLDSGANLIQVYSGWVYHGPSFAADICKVLRNRMLTHPS
ncbi:MAG: quinone-dependent dihydroorotate dehydrogenase [Fimbriimonadaceae bacterium]|nr:MAG: quinone-dependent dihydroorotate dehydrogenase [Fimbriimonadaceae bacterium]